MTYTSRKAFEDATVTLCLDYLNQRFRDELEAAGKGDSWAPWNERQSRYLCDPYDAPPVPREEDSEETREQMRRSWEAREHERQQRRAQEERARQVYVKIREALVAAAEWSEIAGQNGGSNRWPDALLLAITRDALSPLSKHHLFSQEVAENISPSSRANERKSPRRRLIERLDHPFLYGPKIQINAFGLGRAATPREMACVLLSARYFPADIDINATTPEQLITKIAREMTTERARAWERLTGGKHTGPWKDE